MAARIEQERLKARKARLIKQNEAYRRDLQDEAENLRGAADWMERGFVFYKATRRVGKWVSPLRASKNSFAGLLRGCATGFRILRNLKSG